jgi:hypothetical protein
VVSLLLRTQRLRDRFLFADKRQSGAAHRRDRQTALVGVAKLRRVMPDALKMNAKKAILRVWTSVVPSS